MATVCKLDVRITINDPYFMLLTVGYFLSTRLSRITWPSYRARQHLRYRRESIKLLHLHLYKTAADRKFRGTDRVAKLNLQISK